MDGSNVKKDDENGQLSCEIHSSPAAAVLLRSLPRSLDNGRNSQNTRAVLAVEISRIRYL